MITRGWQRSARGELSALVTAAASTPWTLFLRDAVFDPTAPHPTPVVLIHGLFGSASNFLSLRRVLAVRGVSNVHSFSYLPGIDVSRVAHRLGATIEAICAAAYALKWPGPWPTVSGYHEVFHIFVVVGAACHFVTVTRVVLATAG
jgi:pimeloyl-ACP methyl ester carboxylesterase